MVKRIVSQYTIIVGKVTLARSMYDEGHGTSLNYDLDSLLLPTDFGINLGVVVTEWGKNAFKYAYPERRGEFRVKLKTHNLEFV